MTSAVSQSPIEGNEQKRGSFHLEDLDGSPGSTLRSRRIREELDETVEMLEESPGMNRHRRKTVESSQVRPVYSDQLLLSKSNLNII